MKSWLIIFLVTILLIACAPKDFVTTGGKAVPLAYAASEFCYDGVVYVEFGTGNSATGSVKFTPDDKVVTCTYSPQKK
jgi:hypothetical protein